MVTLLLTPDDAEKLTLASVEGSIMLTLRNPLDDGADGRPTAPSCRELLGEASPPPVKQVVGGRTVVARPRPSRRPPPPPKVYTVETIRAAKRY